jgi:hypothetical protein
MEPLTPSTLPNVTLAFPPLRYPFLVFVQATHRSRKKQIKGAGPCGPDDLFLYALPDTHNCLPYDDGSVAQGIEPLLLFWEPSTLSVTPEPLN